MTVRYHFDLYPRTDPRDGSLIGRLSDLQRAEYRGEANGSGVGLLGLRGDSSDGQLIDPAGLQYVRVVSDDTDKVVGGFFLDSGNFAAITKQNTRLLTFGGAGPLSYLDREVMWSHTYLDDAIYQDPYDGTWRLYAQGPIAGGDFLGAVLYRVVLEAQSFRSGAYTHKHGDGTLHTDTHADDRTSTAIPDLVLTFDGFEDSDGNPWTLPSGEFTAQVGESVYQVVQRLMQAGLYVEMDPDTFELRAWEANTHRRDRTGGAFGASVVRFSAGENIKSDAKRKIAAFVKRTAILASTTSDLGAVATASGDVPWHGGIREDLEDVDALEQLATSQLARRSDAGDVLKLRMRLGASPTTGFYRPWEEVLPDDLVTVDSGSGQWDWDEAEFPVAALEIKLREEGDWDAFVELGATFSDPSREFQAVPVAAHHHGPNPMLCDPATEGTTSVLRLYPSFDTNSFNPTQSAAWDTGATDPHKWKATPDGTYTGGGTGLTNNAGGDVAGVNVAYFRGYYGPLSADEAALLAAGGMEVAGYGRVRSKSGLGISEAAQNMVSNIGVRVTTGASTAIRGVALAPHTLASSAGSTKWRANSTHQNRRFPAEAAGNVLSAVSGTAAGDYLEIVQGSRNFTVSGENSGGAWLPCSDQSSDLPEDIVSVADLNNWIDFVSSGVGATTGDLPQDTVLQGEASAGNAARAARCDHEHSHGLLSPDASNYHGISQLSNYVVHGSGAPAVTDDEEDGYRNGTHWIDDDTGDVYFLTDQTEGAAVWLNLSEAGAPGGGSVETDLTQDTVSSIATSGSPAFLNTPGIAKLDDSHLLVLYRQGTDHASSADGNIVYRIGTVAADYSVSWSSQSTVIGTANDLRDPEVAVLSDGTVIASYFESDNSTFWDVKIIRATWDGSTLTWGSAVAVATDYSLVEAISAKIVELFNGDLLAPVYGRDGAGNHSAAVSRSQDAGDSWAHLATIATGTIGAGTNWTEPYISLLADGTLVCLIREDTDEVIYRSTSDDGGSTWSTPAIAFDGDARPAHMQVQSGGLLHVSRADPNGDTIYRESADYGATWTTETVVDSAGTRNEYASIAQFDSYHYAVAYAIENSSSDADVKFVWFTDAANLDIIRGIGSGGSTGGGGGPTGAAGGDLSGTYPNPSVSDDSHAHTSATLPAPTPVAFCGARVYNSAAQSIAENTTDVIALFDTELYDTDAIHDTGSNTGRMTIPTGKSGKWRFTYHITWDVASATGIRVARLLKNAGLTVIEGSNARVAGSTAFNPTLTNTVVVDLVAGDYIQIGLFQNRGGGTALNSGFAHGTNRAMVNTFEAHYLGA